MNRVQWWPFNQWFRRRDDERQQQAHGVAARNAYFTTLILAVLVGIYQAMTGWPNAPLWPAVLAILLSLVVLVVRRTQVAGLGPADERFYRLQLKVFRGPYITAIIGLFLYGNYFSWELGDTAAMMLWHGCCLLAMPVIWFSHLLQGTTQGSSQLWLAIAAVLLGGLGYGIALIVVNLVLGAQSFLTFRDTLSVLPYFMIPLLMALVALGAAWHNWRVERGGDG